MKIALVSPYDYAFPGAVADHVRHLAAHLGERGHDVRVIAPCSDTVRVSDERFTPMGRPVPIPSGGSVARVSLSVWLAPKTKSLLRDEAFDVVHLHEPFSGVLPLTVLELSETANVATFHSFHGTRLWTRATVSLAKRYFNRLQGCIAVSEPARDFISSHFPGGYEIIPNGIQVGTYSNGALPYEHLRDGMVNILFVGRLERRKGLKYLLGAFARLKWSWPNIRLLVVGPGSLDDDSARMIGERNIKDVVFTGAVSEEEKVRYYKTADIFCTPATGRESFGVVLLEAMAAGKPVVASSIEGYRGVMTEGQEGLFFPRKDSEALANALEFLVRNPEARREMGNRGRLTAQNYRWEVVARRVEQYYESCLQAANGATGTRTT
jgi:phosphatidylinositol alpha-mannosyltransferase